MLVNSLERDNNDEYHVINRICERLSPEKVAWVFSLIAEINCYLPNDWRLTKSRNNFKVQVITPKTDLALVGNSYKAKTGEGIINVIYTILHVGSYDMNEAKRLKIKPKLICEEDKIKNPELIQPNLYFFQPCPEDSFSPLFARQYERIKYDQDRQLVDTQYHRIHPLTKAGLDLEHYKWVKWKIDGTLEFVDYPEDDYRGKDYWVIPFLTTKKKEEKVEDYIKEYEKMMKEYGAEKYELSDMLPVPYERELKFKFDDNQNDFDKLLSDINKWLSSEKVEVIWNDVKEQEDVYFDDTNLKLFKEGVSFRLRKQKGNARITVKKRVPVEEKDFRPGLYYRLEEENIITKKQENALLEGKRINPFPYRLVAYLAPGCRDLNKVIIINNKRTLAVIKGKGLNKIELCHDIVTYRKPTGEVISEPEFEIELESKGSRAEFMDYLVEKLCNKFKLTPVSETKYERGISLMQVHSDKKLYI